LQKTTVCELNLRKADRQDGAFLLSVRNSPDVRAQSKTQEVITESKHTMWFDAQLNNRAAGIWILEHQGQREGYVRAQETTSGRWLLSIALQTSSQGKGHGTWAIREGCRLLQEQYGACCIIAEVLAQNTVARRVFQGTGFVEKGMEREQGLDVVRFELTRA
jgi:RimJ/RimL family protein N-acetyltransferase